MTQSAEQRVQSFEKRAAPAMDACQVTMAKKV
jgi:hypothetical protein